MRERGRLNHKIQPERCSLCGMPAPSIDDGYTVCCNEPLVYPGEREYQLAVTEWRQGMDDWREDR